MRNGLIFLFIFIFNGLQLYAQTDSAVRKAPANSQAPARRDTGIRRATAPARPAVKKDTTARRSTATRPAATRTTGSRDTTRRSTASSSVRKPAGKAIAKPGADTAKARTDTVLQRSKVSLKKESAYDSFLRDLAAKNVFLQPNKPRYYDLNPLRPYKDMDWLVYLVSGVLLILGVIRLAYLKYFSDLFRAFLNPTLSQRQLKEQLSQSAFPNFLMNAFFVISLALYLYLLMYRQQYITNPNALLLIPGLIVLVAVIYVAKYLVLRFCGWLFGNADLADSYIFILYLINKIVGIILVPFLVILAFCQPEIANTFLYISLFLIVLLVGYRYVRSYSVIKQYLSFSKLHFFLYLCAFEVAPVLLLTKVLLIWLTGNP